MKKILVSIFLAIFLLPCLALFAACESQNTSSPQSGEKKETVEINFVTNNNKGEHIYKEFTKDQTFGNLPNIESFERDGYTYTFTGWFTANEGGTQVTSDTAVNSINGNVLYAQYTKSPKSFEITFDANGGSVSPTSKIVTYDSPYGTLPTPTRTGYTFAGWSTTAEIKDIVTSSTIFVSTSEQTLYAIWQEEESSSETEETSSFLLSNWQSALTNANSNYTQENIKTITFTKTRPTSGTQVSVGATAPDGATAYVNGTQFVDDIIAFVTTNSLDSSKYDIVFYSPATIYAPTNSISLFSNSDSSKLLTNLTSITFDNFRTSNVKDMSFMFDGCSSLTSLDISIFDTRNVIRMRYMFSLCSNLLEINLSNFNTKNVTDMVWMFRYCTSLESLDISMFDMTNTETGSMIETCTNLLSVKTPKTMGSMVILLPSSDWYNSETLNGAYDKIEIEDMNNITLARGCYKFIGKNVRAYRSASVVGAEIGYIMSDDKIYYGDTIDIIAAIENVRYGNSVYLCYQTTTGKQYTKYGKESNILSFPRTQSGKTIVTGLIVGGNLTVTGERHYSWIDVPYNYKGTETGICGAGEDVTLNWSGLDQGGIAGVKVSELVENGAKIRVQVETTFGSKNNQSGSASSWIELGNSTTLNPVHASWKASITVSVSTSGVSFSFRDMGLYYSYGYIVSVQIWI